MNIVRKCKYKLIRRIDAMTLQNLRNDSLKNRGVGEDFKKGWLPRRGQANLSFVYDDLKTLFLRFK